MIESTDTTRGAATEPSVATAGPLRKRRLADREILRLRAEGVKLVPLAEQAGIRMQTLSAWLRREPQATRLKQEIQLVRLERQAEKREAEQREKAARSAKRKLARDAKAAEPQVVVWEKEAGEAYASYVERAAANNQHGRVLTRKGPIHW